MSERRLSGGIVNRRAAMLVAIAALVTVFVSLNSPAADAPEQTDGQRMKSWGEDLEKGDPQAARALLNFAGRPEAAVAFFKEHLAPLKISEDDLNKLIDDLGSDNEKVWKPAYEKLQYFDPRLTIQLPKLMVDVTDPVRRSRLVEILLDVPSGHFAGKTIGFRANGHGEGFNFSENKSSYWAESKVSRLDTAVSSRPKWKRAVRAIVVLDHIGTPEAIALIKEMTTGHPDASPTKAATAALDSPAADSKDQADEHHMKAWWEDLGKSDPQAARALLKFAGEPDQAVTFFKERLLPLKISEEDLTKLLTDLGSADETVWKAAFEKLEYFDPRLTVDLPKLMVDVTDQVTRCRMVEILTSTSAGAFAGHNIKFRSIGNGEYNFEIKEGSIWAEAKVANLGGGGSEASWENSKPKWTRAVRTIVLLQHIGTPDAVAVIKEMSRGHPDAAPTHAADEALDSMNRL